MLVTYDLIDDNLIECADNILTINNENNVLFTHIAIDNYYTFLKKYLIIITDDEIMHLYYLKNSEYTLHTKIYEYIISTYEVRTALLYLCDITIIIMDAIDPEPIFSTYKLICGINIALKFINC